MATMRMLAERYARRAVPSTAQLTRGIVGRILDAADVPSARLYPEFRELPPNRFRVRVGSGNRLVRNQALFINYANDEWAELFGRGWATNQSRIVDIGSGCGRLVYPLKRIPFEGTYLGIDVDREMIDWANEHLADERIRFTHADVYSSVYNPTGSRDPYRLPVADNTQDIVMSQSLFTHLLQDDLCHYTSEAARTLKPGGRMMMTVFCLGHVELGGRRTFRHRIGAAHVESRRFPEAAVAYDEEFLTAAAQEHGFDSVTVEARPPRQSRLICVKR